MKLPQLSMWNKCCPNTLTDIQTFQCCLYLLLQLNLFHTLTFQLLSESRIPAGKRQIRKPITQPKDSSPDNTAASPEPVILQSSVTEAIMLWYLFTALNPTSPVFCLALLFPSGASQRRTAHQARLQSSGCGSGATSRHHPRWYPQTQCSSTAWKIRHFTITCY